ncbi:hypothetical protein CSKR_101011 [Clonorchis sinensis]|uniref:G-protein coupled receptors family 1 profile domain-containing protein n=1 Tax=Clonorchis sinensis TaxID=79923 RepID=A0A3R7H4Y8_CLOSI|nr:hypothetical protein CSKR_101011 [Clonorchis sinensis]
MSADSCGFLVKNIQSSVNYFRAYVTPILTIVGVFGNAVALYLFATHQPRNRFAIYAMALAISDSLVLLSNSFLDDFVGSGLPFLSNGRLGVKLDALSVEACRLMELTGFWFIFTSGSLLVAFSLDRVACLFRPMQCRTNEGIKVALLVCGVIMALGLLLGLPQVMLFELSDRPAANTTQAYLFSLALCVALSTTSLRSSKRAYKCSPNGRHQRKFRAGDYYPESYTNLNNFRNVVVLQCHVAVKSQKCISQTNEHCGSTYPKAIQLTTDKLTLDARYSYLLQTVQKLEQISGKTTFLIRVCITKEFVAQELVLPVDENDSTHIVHLKPVQNPSPTSLHGEESKTAAYSVFMVPTHKWFPVPIKCCTGF